MVDKNYCMSSYLALRYIEKDDVDFYEGIHHVNLPFGMGNTKTPVKNVEELDRELQKVFDKYGDSKLGLLLSGGMDSATMASYMTGCDAYTFRFLGGAFGETELKRAEFYADYYHLNLHYVDIDWHTMDDYVDLLMLAKASPVHSIEPQMYKAALMAKEDGIEFLVNGEGADSGFGGMDKILSREWLVEDFEKFYTFTDPKLVLKDPVDMSYVFERYRQGDRMDYMLFLREVYYVESWSSYRNASQAAGLDFLSPIAEVKMADPLDLNRVRNGESKYMIRELFAGKYPGHNAPDKVPMPRPLDAYFKDWCGPTRPEFKDNLDMRQFSGNQKWQIYCLERFLNNMEPVA